MTTLFDDPEASRPKLPADVCVFVSEVEARANAATPGPWHTTESIRNLVWFVEDEEGFTVARTSDHLSSRADDAEFIANARADIPALIAIVREQRKVSGELVTENVTLAAKNKLFATERNILCDDNAALRERLAKLEALLRRTHKHMASNVGEKCECVSCTLCRDIEAEIGAK